MALLFLSNCNLKDDILLNIAEEIKGTYSMTYFEHHSAITDTKTTGNSLNINKIELRVLDNKHVDIYVTYPKTPDFNISYTKVKVTEDGDNYTLRKDLPNAVLTGSVAGNKISLDLDYNNKDYTFVDSEKEKKTHKKVP